MRVFIKQRVNYTLTGRITFNKPVFKSSVNAFISLLRYNNDLFIRFILNTDVIVYLTYGIPQFNALRKIRKTVTLNVSTVNNAFIKFSIGSTVLICSISVETFISAIIFYVIDIDTPFLVYI